jgi:MFS family permease
MPSPSWAFFINILNGPAYGLFATCSVAYAKKLAPPALIVTSQGLLNSVMSLAGVISAILTGILFDQIGPRGIFFVMAACCLAGLILFGEALALPPNETPGRASQKGTIKLGCTGKVTVPTTPRLCHFQVAPISQSVTMPIFHQPASTRQRLR